MKLKLRNKKSIVIALFLIGFLIFGFFAFSQKTSSGIRISEQETAKGKIITISAPDELNYENVLSYTELSKEAPAEKIHLYHLVNGEKQEVEITKYDKNNNGLVDYIEWAVPHLSEQTYELEIIIVDAEHLDENRNFVENIYEYVNQIDSITYSIPEEEYVRAYFERNLSAGNVIDIYVYNSEPATIEVYEKDSNEVVGRIEVYGEGLYFTEVNLSGSQDIFDLKSVGRDIIYDYIHDAMTVTDTSFSANESSIINGEQVLLTWGIRCAGNPAGNVILWAEDDTAQITSACGANNFLWISTTITTCEAAGGCSNNGDGTVTATTCANDNIAGTFTIQGCVVGNSNVLDMGTNYGSYTFDLSANVDITGPNTCTAPGSGNWAITCSDACVWNTDFSVPANITISGSGTLTWNANMSFTTQPWTLYKEDGCDMVINSGGSIR